MLLSIKLNTLLSCCTFNKIMKNPNKSNVSDVKLSIGDLRKMICETPKEWVIFGICDKLEELENRIKSIEIVCLSDR